MVGTWKGYYTYKNQKVQSIIGFERTGFVITINSFDGKNFKGMVQDDVSTGGMEEVGLIEGYLKKDEIFFKKLMPKERRIIGEKGTRKTLDQKHPTLFYSGLISNNNSVSGKWKFEIAVYFLFGLIPFPFRSATGFWEMTLQSEKA